MTAYQAMVFAREVHRDQRRKYTGNPYTDHLAEVAGIAATVCPNHPGPEAVLAVAWLHDCIEDQAVELATLIDRFGWTVAGAVLQLTNREQGNRAQRKAAERRRLAEACAWVQTIKVADLISNADSIVQHDPRFAAVFLKELGSVLDVLTGADERLLSIARRQLAEGLRTLDAQSAVDPPVAARPTALQSKAV